MKNILKSALFVIFTVYVYSLCAQTKMWSANQLESVKSAVAKGDTRYAEAYKKLILEANKVLPKSAVSVMDKEGVPPSGDKHDYTSLARYWWPNPNTKDALPYVRHDGKSNPEIKKFDREVIGEFAKNTATLTLAYCLSGDKRYGNKAAELVRVWFIDSKTKMNPNMKFAQHVPGVAQGRAEGVLDTYPLVEVTDAIELLSQANFLSKADMTALRAWFADYASWMQTSETGKGERAAKNNHGLAYDVQLARFLSFAGDDKAASQVIMAFPAERLDKQIDQEGKQPLELARTLAFHYSSFNLIHIMDMCELASALDIDLYKLSNGKIDSAIGYLIPFVGKSETFPYPQIREWEPVEKNFMRTLYRAAKYSPKAVEYMNLYNANCANPEDARFVLLNIK